MLSLAYLARQPILDREGKIYAYELLFRDSPESDTAVIANDNLATAQVLENVLTNIGLPRLIGENKAFINCNREMLLDNIFKLLNPKWFVLEILEDVEVDVIDGSYHEVDSNENAFKMAAIFAMKNAFAKCSPVLLEPIMAVEVVTPAENQGDIMGDLNRRRAMVKNMEHKGAECVLTADVPLAEMFGYSTDIRTLSKGLASYSMEPSHFEQVPQNLVNDIVKARGGNK